MKRVKWLYLCAALLALAPAIASADAIISDSFNRNGDLNGSAPDTPQTPGDTWTAPTDTNDYGYTTSTTGGGELSISDPGTGGSTAALPFAPATGNVYTLSATITDANAGGDWLGMGFMGITSASVDTTEFILNNSGDPWILITGDGTTITYASVNGNFNSYADTAKTSGNPNSVQIILTAGAQDTDTVEFVVNGSQVGPLSTYTGGNPTIESVGVTADGQAGTIGGFQLSTPVPEPASAALLSLGTLGLLRRRRA